MQRGTETLESYGKHRLKWSEGEKRSRVISHYLKSKGECYATSTQKSNFSSKRENSYYSISTFSTHS